MSGIMPIIELLMSHFDELKRDENGTIVYDEQLKEITKNLLNLESLDSALYHTYDEFLNAVTNGAVAYDRQQKELFERPVVTVPDLTDKSKNDEEILSELRKFKENLYNSPQCIPNPESNIFRLPKGCKSKYRYVNDVLKKEIWQSWKPGEQVFISAGTGRGKNTFIKKELLAQRGNQKVVIFENRQSLMQQQIIDIISEIDPKALQCISKENMVIFGAYKNIMIISYQCAALKCMLNDMDFRNFCLQARYLVFDEAHYILDDSPYNKGISFFAQTFLGNFFPNATKIFMSGTMEEIYDYVQYMNRFPKEPLDIIEKKEEDFFSDNLSGTAWKLENFNSVLSLPTDYSYIKPYKYKEMKDICYQVSQTSANEKWLVFVKSIRDGEELKARLESICNDSVYFLSADNKNDDENAEIYNQLIRECRFDCRVLIATTVIYNGINVKDSAVKHIVVPFSSMSVVKQLMGRKRVAENETVKVYFPDVTYGKVKRRYRNCIKDCMEIISLNTNLQASAVCQLNGLVNSEVSKYYYLVPSGTPIYFMNASLNYPVIYKLYYDICFYIFALHRMNPKPKKGTSDFVKILLTHFDIEEKYDEVIEIKSPENDVEEVKAEFSEYLESLTGIDIISPDENGSYDSFLELKRKINEMYKIMHDSKPIDTQWKNKDRFYSDEKLKMFFSELDLPYMIKSESAKGKRITRITKQS